MKVALIDADHIVYVVGYRFREQMNSRIIPEVTKNVDNFIQELITLSCCDHHVIALSSQHYFRHNVYKYAKYKGDRKEKPDWYQYWVEPITTRLLTEWHGEIVLNLEADDIVSALSGMWNDTVICSPDKDLMQCPGIHFNYVAAQEKEDTDHAAVAGLFTKVVTTDEAQYKFWMQMLMGDSGDNVAGVPGLGEVKAKKLLADTVESVGALGYPTAVKLAYQKYFGAYYGPIIFGETLQTIMMMCPEHPFWDHYREQLYGLKPYALVQPTSKIFDVS